MCGQRGSRPRPRKEVRPFESRGIAVRWFDYAGYPPYAQLWGEFVHEVTVLDLLFNCGAASARYMRHVHA